MNNTNIVPSIADIVLARAAYIDAHSPIEPGSARHSELVAHFASDATGAGRWAETAETLRACVDPVRMGYLYGQIFGVQPTFHDVDGPAWATGHEDFINNPKDDIERLWTRTIRDDESFTATLEQFDYFRFDTSTVERDRSTLQVYIDRNDAIEFLSPAQAREAAQKLLAAADVWEALAAAEEAE